MCSTQPASGTSPPKSRRSTPRRAASPSRATGTAHTYGYDRLVVALGSRVAKPDLPGLREFGFDVDTYDGAMRLQRHLARVADGGADPAAATAVVVGAGLTGIETACELPGRLAEVFAGRDVEPRVVLIDHNPHVGSDMGESARPVIEAALSENGVETMTGVGVAAVDERRRDALLRRGGGGAHRRVVCGHAGESADRTARRRARPAGSRAGRRLSAGGRRTRACSPRVMSPRRAWTTSTCR